MPDPPAVPVPSSRSTQLVAAAVAAALAAAIILASSKGHPDRMAYGDGQIYLYVASHLDQPPAKVDPVLVVRGTSLRYGRIGLSAVIWVAAAGQRRAMPYAQPAVIVLAAAMAAAAAALLPGTAPLSGLLPFLAPGFSLSVAGGFAEVLAVAFGLSAIALSARARWRWATAALAAAMLTRENAGAILIGLLLWYLIVRRDRRAWTLVMSVIPVGAWYLFVAARYGHIPILDPYLRVVTDTIGAPIVSVWRSLAGPPASRVAVAAIHLVLAVVGFAMWRRGVLGAIAAAAGLQVLSAGRFSWHFVGDAVRAFTFLQLFVVLAVVAVIRWPERSHKEGAAAVAL